jgi:ubiquinone biosynthesis protein
MVGWAAEFAHSLRAELDFTREGMNCDRLREELTEEDVVTIPGVHWDLTTQRVLTMDFVEGVSPNDEAALAALNVDRVQLARHFTETIFRQITENGFFHADPHSGNLMVLPDGRLALLDFGHVDFAGRELRDYMFLMLQSLVEGDSRGVVNVMVSVGVVGPRTVLPALRLDVDKTVARFAPLGFSPLALSEALDALLGLLVKHGIRVPATFASLLRAIVITQGVAFQLDPQFDPWSFTAEAVRRETRQRLAPHQILATLQSSVREWTHYARMLPRQLSDLLLRTQAGGTLVRLDLEHADRYLHRLDIMVNRLSFAVVVSAIIIGSATILSSARASAAVGSPFAVGFVVAGAFMGLWLLYAIIRSGRM